AIPIRHPRRTRRTADRNGDDGTGSRLPRRPGYWILVIGRRHTQTMGGGPPLPATDGCGKNATPSRRLATRRKSSDRMDRNAMKEQLAASGGQPYDICIIGGGATGLGIAVDAASRGFRTILLEQYDFAKGTSSRATKLVHGGVRYLQQGNVRLVTEALQERGILHRNAPHLVKDLSFIVPNYKWWEGPYYGLGLKVYDWMAGSLGLGKSRLLSREETLQMAPTLDTEGLRGGVLYHDGQFDDARLAIHLAQTAAAQNAILLNYCRVDGLLKKEIT